MNFDEKVRQAEKRIHMLRNHKNAYERIMYPSRRKSKILDIVIDLTIIVPVYNGERYIKRCVSSILSQDTQYSFLLRIVDDGSTDKTPEILSEYKDEKNVEIIRQNNQGVAAARNIGLRDISSKYILFCDVDDYLKQGCIQILLKAAYENDADIVEAGYECFNEEGVICTYRNENVIESGGQTHGGLYGFPWNKVYRRDLYDRYEFPLGYDAFEDTIGTYIIYPSAKKIVRLEEVTYGYRDNKRGYTAERKRNIKSIDTYLVEEYLLTMIRKNRLQIDPHYLYDLSLNRQDWVNFKRIYKLPLDIQKDIFLLKCNLMGKEFSYFLGRGTSIKEWAIRKHNFAIYYLYNYLLMNKNRCLRIMKG